MKLVSFDDALREYAPLCLNGPLRDFLSALLGDVWGEAEMLPRAHAVALMKDVLSSQGWRDLCEYYLSTEDY